MTTRRQALAGMAAMIALPRTAAFAAPAGAGESFSWELLQERALALSRRAWAAPPAPSPLLDRMGYDAAGAVEYRAAQSLWNAYGDASAVRFFPLTSTARRAVSIAVVEHGVAKPFVYRPALYRIPKGHPMAGLGAAGGFSGFRVMNPGGIGDWLAFQGASYFRSAGPLHQYGLSARGLAIGTGLGGPEEFPEFTHFWLERGADGTITVFALLDGPSVSGAFRFVNRRGGDEMTQDVNSVVHLRQSVERLGIAPLTSMFWYGEGNRAQAADWRPEIHDSDGLAMRSGAGERLWRPLNNPPAAQFNSFADAAPRGFGLMQRDRAFDHYQDDAAFQEKRPSLWIEPQGDWGKGAVSLFEIPTTTEYADNIVAFWSPAATATSGMRLAHNYRLRWIGGEPEPLPVARVTDCRTGQGGLPGQPPRAGVTKIVADFQGGRFAALAPKTVSAQVDVQNGILLNSGSYRIDGTADSWRLVMDIERRGAQPVDIRAFLRSGPDAVSETLVYQLI